LPAEVSPLSSPTVVDHGELEGKRVLIVDDNQTNRRVLRLQAERWGMRARDTGSPDEALEWIVRGDPYDVALLDYQMPVMDGLALARALRAARGPGSLPLVLLSSIGGAFSPVQGDTTFTAVLSKPVKLSLLHDRLLEVLAGRHEPQTARTSARASTDRGPLRILLAEDNEINQTVALRLLER